ncbi:helix-turn-helix domain-containing protein [Chitinophaga japonensis]|nr:AraC family transcriptional regulator [Chitinophaga japonensis]
MKKFYYEQEHHTTFSQCMDVPGCRIWWHAIKVRSEKTAISATATQTGLRLNFTLGLLDADAALNKRELVKLKSAGIDLFYVYRGGHDAELPAGTHIFFHLDISKDLFVLMQQNPAFSSLSRAVKHTVKKGNGHINSRPVPINLYCATLIEDIRQHTYEGFAAKVYLNTKVWSLLQYFARHFAGTPAPSGTNRLTPQDVLDIDTLKAHLKQHMSQPFSLEKLCAALNLRHPQLQAQRFKQLHDISLHAFYRRFRMEEAFNRVTRSGFKISFISEKLGYKSAAAFSRAFRQHFGYSPAALREATRGTS